MYRNKLTEGYSLVEVLIAVSILMISVIGPLTIASKGLQNAILARQQNTAFFLAQEGIEAIVQIRNTVELTHSNWASWTGQLNQCSGTGCGVTIGATTNNIFKCTSNRCDVHFISSDVTPYKQDTSAGEKTIYNRKLFFQQNGTEDVQIRSIVTWTGQRAAETVELEGYVYNIYE